MLLLALVTGCASTPPGTGGSGSGDGAPEPSPSIDLKAAREEAAQVAARVWAVASNVHDTDSQLRFTFWSEQGALTLLGFVAENRGGRQGKPATDADGTQRAVMKALLAAMQQSAREVSLTLRRGESSWQVESSDFIQSFRPLGARTQPLRPGALTQWQNAADLTAAVRGLLGTVQVPSDGTLAVDLTARVRNGRMVGLELTRTDVLRSGRGGKARPVAPPVAAEVAHLILLYAPCTGARSIHLGLRLSHQGTATVATGGVEATRVDSALPTEDEDVSLRLPR
jgi:hypothetical protein